MTAVHLLELTFETLDADDEVEASIADMCAQDACDLIEGHWHVQASRVAAARRPARHWLLAGLDDLLVVAAAATVLGFNIATAARYGDWSDAALAAAIVLGVLFLVQLARRGR